MSRLLGPLFEGDAIMALPLVALVLFFGVFVLAVVRVFTQDRAVLDAIARQPLDDEERES